MWPDRTISSVSKLRTIHQIALHSDRCDRRGNTAVVLLARRDKVLVEIIRHFETPWITLIARPKFKPLSSVPLEADYQPSCCTLTFRRNPILKHPVGGYGYTRRRPVHIHGDSRPRIRYGIEDRARICKEESVHATRRAASYRLCIHGGS